MLPKLQLSLKHQNALREKICEIEQSIKSILGLRNTFGDHIIIRDEVLVYEGDKLLFKSRGHVVNQGLIVMINLMAAGSIAGVADLPSNAWNIFTKSRMRVGIGVGVTTGAMITLVNEVATNPNTQSGVTAMPVLGTYRVSWIGLWNAGTLAAINVSEIGLFLNISIALQVFGAAGVAPTINSLFSRLSDSDGDFVTFLVNIAVPLTIEWRLWLTFA